MPAARLSAWVMRVCCRFPRGSHVLTDLVKSFPKVRVVCLDKLNYCGTVRNLEEIKGFPNFEFVKVCVAKAPHL